MKMLIEKISLKNFRIYKFKKNLCNWNISEKSFNKKRKLKGSVLKNERGYGSMR